MKKGFLKSAFAAQRAHSNDVSRSVFDGTSGIPLTGEEAALVKSIFGKKINTKRVRKHLLSEEERLKTKAAAETIGKKHIIFYSSLYHAEDYSLSKDRAKYGTFIHEMTHIWQHQHKIRSIFNMNLAMNYHHYAYELLPHSRFKDFGNEQQAAIIEDYALNFLYAGRDQAANDNNYKFYLSYGSRRSTNPQSLALLQKVVEDRFPEARKTRLALEAQGKTAPVVQPPKPS